MKTTRFNDQLTAAALKICRQIDASGEKVYVVGGTLRDILLGRDSLDIDLATTATPAQMTRWFKRVIPTGIQHGTVTILVDRESFEVTTLRGEAAYSDGRRPDGVTYIRNIRDDLARRDFTINAMAWDPIDEELHDPHNGHQDLEAGLIRAVGDPVERFTEDGLRVLRAARFATTHKFTIEQNTAEAIPVSAGALGNVAAERKRDELLKMLRSDRPSRGFVIMQVGGLLPHIFKDLPTVADWGTRGDGWSGMLRRLDATPQVIHIRIAAIFFGMENAVECCTNWLRQMRFDRQALAIVPKLLAHANIQNYARWKDADIRRFVKGVGKPHAPAAIELKRADMRAASESLSPIDAFSTRVKSTLQTNPPLELSDLAIGGDDLIESCSLSPGPAIGRALNALLEHVLDHPEDNTKTKLLSLATSRF